MQGVTLLEWATVISDLSTDAPMRLSTYTPTYTTKGLCHSYTTGTDCQRYTTIFVVYSRQSLIQRHHSLHHRSPTTVYITDLPQQVTYTDSQTTCLSTDAVATVLIPYITRGKMPHSHRPPQANSYSHRPLTHTHISYSTSKHQRLTVTHT